MMLTKTNICSV